METGWLFSIAPLQDLGRDALSQDTSMLGNGHDILVLSEKKKTHSLTAICRKIVVINVQIYDTLT